ncbi:MATE family efflux transporter [Pseudoalteromonas sp. MMG013]|uniref:MATE family efflux transporter n=1 Tax=unclassified Pseudoalteromonas TaxID=194690 RepID=UPI001B35F794|nr:MULTISPECIES: MATE family efflux transporter [unclassified Pseudoalteromonas]MBQ4847949.1 MATE family efflux transporter [Pseudoalteromonas sp. MMG005]MBQ4863759.1 MATE family efflux transporter [Pseudoalteromonas sp. MMG013]
MVATSPSIFDDLKKVSTLAGPLILTNLLYVAIATIDLVMLGMLSPLDLAAGGLAIGIFNQFRTMGTGVVTATGNLVSYAEGKAQTEKITPLLNASLLIGTLIGVIFALLMANIKPFLLFIGTPEVLAEQTETYLVVAALGLVPCFWFQSIRHFSVGLKSPGPLMMITGVSVILTVILNYGFIFGHFGLPELGFLGVAVATCIVLYLSFFLFVIIACKNQVLKPYITWKVWKTNKESLSKTWHMGYPIGATYGSEAGFFTVLALFVATLGISELAAHNVVSQIVYIVFMIAAGLSSACSIYVSEAHAKSDKTHAKRVGHFGLLFGASIMGVIAITYVLLPEFILAPFLSATELQQSNVVAIATQLLLIAAVLQVFDASQNIGVGILRGVGDVKSAFFLSILGYWVIGLPVAWLLSSYMNLGINGVWYALTLGLSVTALSQLWMFNYRVKSLDTAAEIQGQQA